MPRSKEAPVNPGAWTPKAPRWIGSALPIGFCAVLLLGLPAVSTAQSPFTGPPSRSGTFSIPEPGESRGLGSPSILRPGAAAKGATRPLRSGAGTISPTMPTPLPVEPGSTGLPPLPDARGGANQLPIPLPSTEEMKNPAKLPPRPEVAERLSAVSTAPIPKVAPILLKAGMAVTVRICQLLPKDGYSAGERLLNGQPPLQPGDCFLAEVIEPCPPYPILVGGTVVEITPPRHFGKPGYVSIRMTQLVQTTDGQTGMVPWRMDLADRRFVTKMRRAMLTALLSLEGAGTGASIGAQFFGPNMPFIGGGMGIGAIVGLGYASLRRGTEANFEPGDTFEIIVGTTKYRPVSREWQTILYPAANQGGRKLK